VVEEFDGRDISKGINWKAVRSFLNKTLIISGIILGGLILIGAGFYSGYTYGVDVPKNIVIKGSVKLNTCQLMERGTVTIEGNCDAQSMFCMKGGTIVINGNLNASECCEHMTGGAIIVKGDLIGEMEDGMYGGELHVYGDYTDKEVRTIGKWKSYHKGVLVTGKEE